MSAAHRKITQKGDFEILLGSGEECDYIFTELQDKISLKHAQLKRTGDRLFLRDLDSAQGTFINGKKIGSRWHEITLQDKVFLGKTPMEIGPSLLLGRDRVGLDANDLYFTIPHYPETYGILKKTVSIINDFFSELHSGIFPVDDRKERPHRRILSNHISIAADPGTLTAIMGPSGAGKTVLLNLMAGYRKPEKGRVMVGNFNVHESFGLVRDIIGYVPQEDTLIPELTVHQSLHYCLQLGYPDMEADVRQTLIETVLKRMGFSDDEKEKRLQKLLRTKIGSVDQRGLSGGERRRVNIAHELIRSPLLLYLDEPTSGLSSVDSEHVVGLLREICTVSKVTMLMTIHQPGKSIFQKLDNLLLMNRGGNVAYYGPADEAVEHFEKLTGKKCGDTNPADYVLQVLEDWNMEFPPEKYFFQKRNPGVVPYDENFKITDKEKTGTQQRKHHHVMHQLRLLFQRNIQVKLADKVSLALIFFQSLFIGLLLTATFSGFQKDYKEADVFARTWSDLRVRYHSEATVLNLGQLREESILRAEAAEVPPGENTAQRRASVLFLLIASAIWFGVINGAREIVSEKSTLKREAKGSLCLFSYLMAKFCVLLLIALVQTGILLLITVSLLEISDQRFFHFWFILILTALSASGLSLFVSALVKTEQASLMIVPLIIIPQLFLGGLIRPVKFLSGKLIEMFPLNYLILQKWSFKAMLLSDSLKQNVLIQNIDLHNQNTLDYICFEKEPLIAAFFGNVQNSNFFQILIPIAVIAVHALIPLMLAYICLIKKYS